MGIVNFILGGTGLEKRKYPLRTEIACGLREDISIELDRNFSGTISMPSYTPVEDAALGYRREVELNELTLACSRELKLKTVEFSPEEYLKLKRSLVTITMIAKPRSSRRPPRSQSPQRKRNRLENRLSSQTRRFSKVTRKSK